VCVDQHSQHAPAEQGREHLDGHEIVGREAIQRDPSGEIPPPVYHVHVGMMGHCRSPGVQDRGDADLGTEVLGVGGNGEHGLGDGADLGGQREDDVEVGDLQQLGLALFHPGKCLTALAIRAMTVAATAVRDDGMATLRVLAARDIAAKRRGAEGLNRAHHLQLCVAHVAAVSFTPSGPEVAEDFGDFQSGTFHERAPVYFGRSSSGRSGVNRSRDVDAPGGRMNVENVLTRQM
jgi:hypothetical protein